VTAMSEEQLARARWIRRTTLWLIILALAFYLGFIALSVSGVRG